ncbi:MAG: hypothetical protein J6K25_07470 [Thermoguttaceae bacterium]|nr:hypothetical protein [Thermoguttaceae bacterium]
MKKGFWNGTRRSAALAAIFAAAIGNFPCESAQGTQGASVAQNGEIAANEETTQNGETLVLTARDGRAEAALETSATEIFFGDAVYFRATVRNVSDAPLGIELGRPFESKTPWTDFALFYSLDEITVEAPGVAEKFVSPPEFCSAGYPDILGWPAWTNLKSGATNEYAAFAVEFPALDDWNAPFWRAVRERLATEERVELSVRVAAKPRLALESTIDVKRFRRETFIFETKIALKRRPEAEMERLDEWFASTPSELFPKRVERSGKKGPSVSKVPASARSFQAEGREIESSGRSDVALDGFENGFDVWKFVRFGNRKPSDPNNPTTLDGWRALEAEFAPSTIRDEIRFVRLQLEYYSAAEGAATDAALSALTSWLDSLPTAQRSALVRAVASKSWLIEQAEPFGTSVSKRCGTELAPKYARLCAALGRVERARRG